MPIEQPTFSDEEIQSEQWQTILDYFHYSASTLGRIRRDLAFSSTPRGEQLRYLRYGLTKKGRYKVQLWHNGKGRWFEVGNIIARTFLGPKPAGLELDHFDGNPLNNRSVNLRYITHRENVDHAMALGRCPKGDTHYLHRNPERALRGEKNGSSKITDAQREEIRRRRAQGEKLTALGAEFGLHFSTISDITKPRPQRPKRPVSEASYRLGPGVAIRSE